MAAASPGGRGGRGGNELNSHQLHAHPWVTRRTAPSHHSKPDIHPPLARVWHTRKRCRLALLYKRCDIYPQRHRHRLGAPFPGSSRAHLFLLPLLVMQLLLATPDDLCWHNSGQSSPSVFVVCQALHNQRQCLHSLDALKRKGQARVAAPPPCQRRKRQTPWFAKLGCQRTAEVAC